MRDWFKFFFTVLVFLPVALQFSITPVRAEALPPPSRLILEVSAIESLRPQNQVLFSRQILNLIIGWYQYVKNTFPGQSVSPSIFSVSIVGDPDALHTLRNLLPNANGILHDRFGIKPSEEVIIFSNRVPDSILDGYYAGENEGVAVIDFQDRGEVSTFRPEVSETEAPHPEEDDSQDWFGIREISDQVATLLELNLTGEPETSQFKYRQELVRVPLVPRDPAAYTRLFTQANGFRSLISSLNNGHKSPAHVLQTFWEQSAQLSPAHDPISLLHFYLTAYWSSVYRNRGLATELDLDLLSDRVVFEVKSILQAAAERFRADAQVNSPQSFSYLELHGLLEEIDEMLHSFMPREQDESQTRLSTSFLVRLIQEVIIPLKIQIQSKEIENYLDEIISLIQSDMNQCQNHMIPTPSSEATPSLPN